MTAPKGSILRKDMKYPVREGANAEDQEALMKAHVKLYRKHSLTIVQAKDIQAKFRAEIKELREKLDETILEMEQGKAVMMDCEEVKNFDAGTYTVKRKDNGKVVFKRDLTEEDKQLTVGSKANEEEEEDKESNLESFA